MYRNFFSLSELPFSISPNPKYLFMSDRHKEALAHLTYGLGETGGFALLTGEVGTGKTTISRCLLAQLPENTQTAFILNPTLSSQELLATICDELKIKYRKTNATLKYLTDKIAEKLLKNHQNNINTLLIIDEAQHLQVEVLEQLRLLTNLETDIKKLLQVILIGQPELQQLLQRRDLRQLAQRITARYHLMPLTKNELVEYIKHRLFIADCHRNLFNAGALAKIHQLSKGIPRLINLLCHSALMHAYNHNQSIVNKKAVKKAGEQILGDELYIADKGQSNVFKVSLVASIISLGVVIAFVGFNWNKSLDTSVVVLEENSLSAKKSVSTKDSVPTKKSVIKSAITTDKTNEEATELSSETLINKQESVVIESSETDSTLSNKNTQAALDNMSDQLTETETEAETETKKVINVVQHKPVEEFITPQELVEKEPENKKDIQLKKTSDVSPELLALFQTAMEETDDETYDNNNSMSNSNSDDVYQEVKPLTDMPTRFQRQLPNLHFSQHIYSSDGEGWVNVNGRDRYEGDNIAKGLVLDKILPQKMIMTYQDRTFSLAALTHWKK